MCQTVPMKCPECESNSIQADLDNTSDLTGIIYIDLVCLDCGNGWEIQFSNNNALIEKLKERIRSLELDVLQGYRNVLDLNHKTCVVCKDELARIESAYFPLLSDDFSSPSIKVHVRGSVAYCDNPYVDIIDHDNDVGTDDECPHIKNEDN